MTRPRDSKVTRLIIRRHWDARAATFDSEPGHGLHDRDQREAWLGVLAHLTGDTPQRVLDVGCGTGFLALLLAELGHRVTGIDLAPQMLNLARQKGREKQLTVQFRLENAASLSDPDGTYDLVVARHVIWNLPDPARAVGEWLRVLRPGGRLALIEGNWSQSENKTQHSAGTTRTPAARARAMFSAIAHHASEAKHPAALVHGAIRSAYHWVRQPQWTLFIRKLSDWRYEQIHAQLPFFGGPPAERLVELLKAQGLRDITVEPLMRPVLWGEVPQHPRYLATGRR
jgi:ubiquinone/menaquinone biosynthesis C-methylase UbiE